VDKKREESCPSLRWKRGVCRSVRAVTVGEWNCHYSMGEEEGQCGLQNGCKLVTNNVGAVYFL
jgi:hypothetical protein